MVNNSLVEFLKCKSIKFLSPVNTSRLVSFKVGGSGKIAIYPKNQDELIQVLRVLKHEKFVLLGNGTNCYFTDGLFDGAIVVSTCLNVISVHEEYIFAGCGASVSSVCKAALNCGLSGIEFAYGIPGTVGGAVCMNASAFGGTMEDVVCSSIVYDCTDDSIYELDHVGHCFGKKSTVFRKKPIYVLSTKFKLKKGCREKIELKMDEYIAKRLSAQPYELPSAGSVFIRPENTYASLLIDKAGLKGYCVGGAVVSPKHAGFIVNADNATAKDIKELIEHIKKVVYERFSVRLQEEIICLE